MSTLKIIGLTGSLRTGAFTRQMMETLQDLAPDDMEITLPEIGHLPFYNEDLKTDGVAPEAVRKVSAAIGEADGLIVGSPEYNRSFPAVLKNVIDWASKDPDGPLGGKPTLIATQSPGQLGGILSNYHLRQVLSVSGTVFLTGGEVAITHIGSKVEGGRITDADTREFLSTQLGRLADLIRQGQ